MSQKATTITAEERERFGEKMKEIGSLKGDIGYATIPKSKIRWLLERLRWIDGLSSGEELEMLEEWLK